MITSDELRRLADREERESWYGAGAEIIEALHDSADAIEQLQGRATGLDVKYGRDHSSRITVGALVDKFLESGDSESFCDVFDEEFLYGCHKDTFDGPVHHFARKDVRGIVWELVSRLQKAQLETSSA